MIGKIIVALDSSSDAAKVADAGCALAQAFGSDWEAVHVETPRHGSHDQESAAHALGLAARLGATVAKIPAATVAAGLISHLENVSASQVVIGMRCRPRRYMPRATLLDDIVKFRPNLIIHVIPTVNQARSDKARSSEPESWRGYAYALATVTLTVAIAVALNRTIGVQYLSFLFFLPVIATAARIGTKPAVLAAIVCSAAFNVFFLDPPYLLKPAAIMSWIMGAAFIVVAIYTGALTANLRARAVLSERSAQENANIAAFVGELTRAADWGHTAMVICSQFGAILDVQTVLIRQIAGSLELVHSEPAGVPLDPLDRTALEWTWAHNEPAGSGSAVLSTANWRFEPLTTSLGTLAVVGLARLDGRDPIPADRKLLLSTLVAQSALALERLRLEEMIMTGATAD